MPDPPPTAILVTGAGGFIGSHLVDHLLATTADVRIVALDAERTGWSPHNLDAARGDDRLTCVKVDVRDEVGVRSVLELYDVSHVVHLAAETHVDRSIDDPRCFVDNNVVGTQVLLEACRSRGVERLLNVITDEVYGPQADGVTVREGAPLAPSSPYAASKAAQLLLGQAYHRTWDLPVIAALPSNTYGPRQYPEKLIPRFVRRLARGLDVPLMASTHHRRCWLWVGDLCRGLSAALWRGTPGAAYNLGGAHEVTNREIAHRIVDLCGADPSRITIVPDRPGHDARYAMDSGRARRELDWRPRRALDDGLAETVDWMLRHGAAWWPE